MESSHPATRYTMTLPSFDSLFHPSQPLNFIPQQYPGAMATYHQPPVSLSSRMTSPPDPGNLGSLSALSQLAAMSRFFPASLSPPVTSLSPPITSLSPPVTSTPSAPASLPPLPPQTSSATLSSSSSPRTSASPPGSPGSVEESDDAWSKFASASEKLYLVSKGSWSSLEEQLELHQKICLALQQAITANAEVGKELRALGQKAKEASRSPGKVTKPTSFSYFSELDFSTPSASLSSSASSSSNGGRLVSIADMEFRKRKRRMSKAEPAICRSCNATSTPEWRKGPDGPRTLCNACGLHYAKLVKKPEEDEPK